MKTIIFNFDSPENDFINVIVSICNANVRLDFLKIVMKFNNDKFFSNPNNPHIPTPTICPCKILEECINVMKTNDNKSEFLTGFHINISHLEKYC